MKRPPPRTLCGGQVLAALGVALFLGGGFPDCTHTGQSPDLPAEPPLDYDVIVAGATLGGTAAAIQSVRGGARTLLIASSSWIGGQATEEGVPFDLPYLSDPIGCLESGAPCRYMERRTFGWLEELTADVRRIYAERFGVTTENPGECWLTDCVEPRIVHEAIRLEIASLTATGNLDVLLSTEIADSGRRRDGARWVLLRAPGGERAVSSRLFIEATARGDILPLLGIPFQVGRELQSRTGEPDAMKDPSREGLVQPFTFVVALRRFSGAAPPIPYSPSFEPYLSRFRIVYGGGMFGRLGLWSFRRIVSRNVFPERDEVSLINATFGNDFSPPGEFGKQSHEANILVSDEAIVRERLEQARTQSHAYAYWIQHEAPRDGGGGKGFPELGLDAETFGDPSGLAPAPYIRESRRIRALTTIVQQDVVAEGEKPAMSWARIFPDSVGWGAYPLDNHGGAISRARRFTRPHTIPFSALVPESADDVIAGSKNIGTTHLTNSAYRLHPVEIQVGQAAGAAAALAAANGLDFHGIAASAERMRELQQILLDHGAEIVPMRKPRPRSGPWRSVQTAVVAGWMSPGNPADLDFQAAEAVSWRTFCREVQPRARPRAGACAEGLAISDEPPTVKAAAEKLGIQVDEARDGPLTRGDLAKLLEAVLLEDVPLSRGRAALEFLASGVLANATPSTLQLPPDVPATSPYAGAVLALVAAGAARPDEPFEPFRDLRWADVDAWIGGPGRLAEERETMIHPNRTLTEGVLSAVLSRRARAPGIPAQSPSPEP